MIWNLDQKPQAVSFLDSVIIWGKGHSQASPLHSFPWEALLKEASLFLPCVFFSLKHSPQPLSALFWFLR